MAKERPIVGVRFGALVGLSRSQQRALVKCDCGVEKWVFVNNLLQGKTKSCGCKQGIPNRQSLLIHGHGSRKSGESLEYNTWLRMKARCQNPNHCAYKHYGGRGIRVCERWQRFPNFLADMGHRPSAKHSIDRIDVNGDYCLENCRWATAEQQSNNTRRNVRAWYKGEYLTHKQIANRAGVSFNCVQKRIRRGIPLDFSIRGRKLQVEIWHGRIKRSVT